MAQDRWINITLDPNAAVKKEIRDHRHSQGLGAAAAGDLTISFDTAKFTSLTLFRSAVMAAIEQASGSMKPCLAAVLLLFFLSGSPVSAQVPNTQGVQITASSGNVAAGTATATLAAVAGNVTYICGFAITSGGSTAAAVVAPTIVGVVTGTMTFAYATVAGVTLANAPLVVTFRDCISASAPNTTIVVSMPTLGAGNTNTTVNAWGLHR